MRSSVLSLLASGLLVSAALAAEPALNTLTPAEKEAGWRLLWDGHSSAGWRSAKAPTFPAQGWTMKDGLLCVESSGGREGGVGGDIITEEQFGDFELTVDFRISEGANSGIKYYVDPELNKGEGSAIGLEYQLLDDARHPDAKLGRNGNRTLASVYDLYPARADKPAHPPGQWNTARIVSRGGHVEHWLNGVKVVEFDRGTPQFRQDVAASKYRIWPHFGEAPRGPILLQDHGDAVCFRNLKIRVLSSR
jgi:hypothetical protein